VETFYADTEAAPAWAYQAAVNLELVGVIQTDEVGALALEQERWIIDGNYASTMERRLQACDTVFFLDYPMEVCLAGIEACKGQLRSDLPWREAETPDTEFLRFVRRFSADSRPVILSLMERYPEKDWKVFLSREQAQRYLNGLET